MPHVTIKHFPVPLGDDRRRALVDAVTSAVSSAFGCDEGVISIALEPVDREEWTERVYVPEILGRQSQLCKAPDY